MRAIGFVFTLFLFVFEVHASSHEFTIRVIEDDGFSNVFELSLPPRAPARGATTGHSPNVKQAERRNEDQRDTSKFLENPDKEEEDQEKSEIEDESHDDPAEPEEPDEPDEPEEPEEIEPPEPKEPPELKESPEPKESTEH